jgi:hypothetical protein
MMTWMTILMIIRIYPNCNIIRDYESSDSMPEYLNTEENQESKIKR